MYNYVAFIQEIRKRLSELYKTVRYKQDVSRKSNVKKDVETNLD